MSTISTPGAATASGVRNGEVSYWYSSIGLPSYRGALPGDRDADVCIVGAGFTGLWTAYYLLHQQPDLRVVLLEKEFAGFGASGRNGGWLSAELAGSRERYAATHGHQAVVELLRLMRSAIDEVTRVATVEGIDADIVKDGVLHVARNRAQQNRLRHEIDYERGWGAAPEDLRYLEAAEIRDRIAVAGARAGLFVPHCARVQPAKLVRGLAAAVERAGGKIFEQTTVSEIRPGSALTDRGTVSAPIVLRCLEGFTASIRGARRAWLPMNSSMVVTEPLSDSVRSQIGWQGAELLGDFAHAYMYAQRTADNRIALGGRGIPYRFGSRTDQRGHTQPRTIETLTSLLHHLLPATAEVNIAQAWCGVLGVPRDWCATVSFDRPTGLGTAGGYVGSGLTTTNLAGRTLADLALRRDSPLVELPWVGRRVRPWEPEPLRWAGVHAMYALYRAADRREDHRDLDHTSNLARLADKITGR
ncbi:NAD(P)/FAD-dependent oxidoreductase [Leekyejoonella antrihumi]|uniref:FAD-dependent oxidoreductase n=1 Tax=Leekyejoonella antrihumi TaxID=1660198 RepID=A0A563DS74_9MICO|nr:FAD-dependent oxidoreductase [Leekyejoonella antrihumi]TWP32544.1 FAD-dependent oxidoreductase [Leekyejoonella antrihumi]